MRSAAYSRRMAPSSGNGHGRPGGRRSARAGGQFGGRAGAGGLPAQHSVDHATRRDLARLEAFPHAAFSQTEVSPAAAARRALGQAAHACRGRCRPPPPPPLRSGAWPARTPTDSVASLRIAPHRTASRGAPAALASRLGTRPCWPGSRRWLHTSHLLKLTLYSPKYLE